LPLLGIPCKACEEVQLFLCAPAKNEQHPLFGLPCLELQLDLYFAGFRRKWLEHLCSDDILCCPMMP